MSDFNDAVDAIRSILPPYIQTRIKITGFIDPTTGQVGADPTSGAPPGKLYVHGYPRGSNAVVLASPGINPRVPNVPVLIGQNQAHQAVAFQVVIDDNAVKTFGATLPSVGTNPPPIDFAVAETPLSMMGGGRVLPLASTTPGLTVYIEAFPEVGWVGGNIVISGADIPASANQFRWAVFYFPEYTGTPVTPTYALTTAVVKPTKGDLLLSDAANLALTAGVIRGGAVSLAYAQTDLTADNSRFENELRRNFVPEDVVIVDRSGGADGDVPTYVAASDSFVLAPQTGGGGGSSVALRSATIMHLTSLALAGSPTWSDVIDAAQFYNHRRVRGTAANADSFTNGFELKAGTYVFSVLGLTAADRAILDWYVSDNGGSFYSILTGQDWYSLVTARNVIQTASVTIVADGYHVIKGVTNGRNGSNSTGYVIDLTAFWFAPATD